MTDAEGHLSKQQTQPVGPSQTTPPPIQSWGTLKIIERISRGGFGDVYRAYDPDLQREVALKLARSDRLQRPGAAKRFLAEARTLARIRHPHVVVVHGVAEHDGCPGFWTDLIQGKTLAEMHRDQGNFGPHEASAVGIVLCQALAALHNAGLVHRDVKPQNVMREQGGRYVLLDFGSADVQLPESTTIRGVEGTARFMAPEVLLQSAPARVTSDIYSLGVLLFWLASGKYPVNASTREELYDAHEKGTRQHLLQVRPDLPAGFVQIVERCVDSNPERRFDAAAELERALADYCGADRPPDPVRRRWYRSKRVAFAAIAVVGLGLVTGWLALVPGKLGVDIALYKESNGETTELAQGGRVRLGDRIFLQIRGSRPFYAYVFNEDAFGNRFVLFPGDSSDVTLLHPRRNNRLPLAKPGRSRAWEITSAGGKETFLVLASRRSPPDIEKWIAQFPRVDKSRRAAGGIVEEEAAHADTTGGLVERMVEFYAEVDAEGEKTVIWRLELENALP